MSYKENTEKWGLEQDITSRILIFKSLLALLMSQMWNGLTSVITARMKTLMFVLNVQLFCYIWVILSWNQDLFLINSNWICSFVASKQFFKELSIWYCDYEVMTIRDSNSLFLHFWRRKTLCYFPTNDLHGNSTHQNHRFPSTAPCRQGQIIKVLLQKQRKPSFYDFRDLNRAIRLEMYWALG